MLIRTKHLLNKTVPRHKIIRTGLFEPSRYQSTVLQKDYPYFYRVLESLPKGRSLAFAYGSGVFKQAGKVWTKNSMSDFIIVANHPLEWHEENMSMNPHHYPKTIRALGSSFVSKLQTDYGAKIYFNTLIPFEDGKIKYGVISTEDLLKDLQDWDTLYVSGRLHKPVNILELDRDNVDLKVSLVNNLTAALRTALILLPERLTERDLYLCLTGLSYSGDLRMLVGEDKNKVDNIVSAQMDLFKGLYSERLKSFTHCLETSSQIWIQDKSETTTLEHLKNLPSQLQTELKKELKCDQFHEGVMGSSLSDSFNKSISIIVQRSSTPQAVKGIVSAGPSKAVVYSWAKLKKMFKSLV